MNQPELKPEFLARTLAALLQEAQQQIVVLTTILNQQQAEITELRSRIPSEPSEGKHLTD